MKLIFSTLITFAFTASVYADGGTIQGVENKPEILEWDTQLEYAVQINNTNRSESKIMEFTAIQIQYDSYGYYIKNLSTCLEAYVLEKNPHEVCIISKK